MKNQNYKTINSDKRVMLISTLAWKWFWLPLVVGFLFLLAIILLLSRKDHASLMSQIKEGELRSLELYLSETSDTLDHVFFDLKWLPRQNELLRWLDTGSQDALEEMVKEYVSLSKGRPFYHQLRLLNETGDEVFRVGVEDEITFVVPEEELQNKSDRYYFKESYMLSPEEIYVSPLDLNVEHGQIEMPYKPMIRFVTPVYDSRKQWRGSLVLNYLGKELIEVLRQTSERVTGSLMLLNESSYWLISVNPDDEWGFMLEERKDRMFRTAFPKAWSVLNQSPTGQFFSGNGLFSFATIDSSILEYHAKNSTETEHFHTVFAPGMSWKVVSYVSPQVLMGKFVRLEQSRFISLVLAGFCSILVASLLYRGRKKHKNHELELEQMAFYDNLTGLASRALFIGQLHDLLKGIRRDEDRFALMVIDLDGFKMINDSFGHDGGDQVLCLFSERLKQSVRATDTVARTGGDEFSVILPRIEDTQVANQVAQKILDNLKKPFQFKDQNCYIGASIGISISANQQELDADALWKQADIAMYQAKQTGKNRYCNFSSEEGQPVEKNISELKTGS